VERGFCAAATDDFVIHAVEGRMHTTDLHAMLLTLRGSITSGSPAMTLVAISVSPTSPGMSPARFSPEARERASFRIVACVN